MRGAVGCLILVVVAAIMALIVRDYARTHPQDVPWTALNLDDPIGQFTVRKLVRLRSDPALCRALLAQAHSGDVAVPARRSGEQCGYSDGMRLVASSRNAVTFSPGVVTSCPVAAALQIFEAQIVQPAALRHYGTRVRSIDHAGSYSCRRLYGRSEGAYSEHATANAFDLMGFRLNDGRRISVLRDWRTADKDAAFLRDVRDGACRLFATVLSPDYNAAHADHLHLDQAQRGAIGGSVCR
jgi:hypothetical protein